jgi:hypothetical protein
MVAGETLHGNATSAPQASPRSSSPRGKWTIAAVFAVGFAVLAGLMFFPRERPPAAPPELRWGAADRALLFVTCDLAKNRASKNSERVRAAAREAGVAGQPDYVLLLNAAADEAMVMARELDMHASYRPQHHQRVKRAGGGDASAGVCILSPHPLYEGGPLRIDRKHSAGVSVVSAVGGKKFRVACLYLTDSRLEGAAALAEQRRAEAQPPAVLWLAAEPAARASLTSQLAGDLVELLPPAQGEAVAVLATGPWAAVRQAGSGTGVTWCVLGAAGPASAPDSQPASSLSQPGS